MSIGLTIRSGSDELTKFTTTFEPYSVKDDAGKALRKKGFRAADPNGNGLCSLAEIENFILSTLIGSTDADQGRALFDGVSSVCHPAR